MRPRQRIGFILLTWAAVFAAAVALDRPVAVWIDRYEPIGRSKPLGVRILKMAGDFKYVAIAIGVAAFVHPSRWRAGVLILLSCAISGVFYGSKWVFGRHRPSFDLNPYSLTPFKDGFLGIVYAKNMAFPSGHACLSFAAASCLAILFPRWTIAFFTVAIMLGVERVLEGAHYPSDVVAGAAFGMLSTYLARWWLGDGWLRKAAEATDIPAVSPQHES